MKKMKSWMLAAILFCGASMLPSCNGTATADKTDDDTAAVVETTGSDAFFPVMLQYLVDSIGVHYAQGEICIPSCRAISINETNPDSLLVLGDFWVFNYNQVGDTLKCVSGGSHPGKMVFQKDEKGEYVVTLFDQVEDGARNIESAKRIFGDMYNFFDTVNSDEKSRERIRAEYIANYVKEHNLPVKYYQDYGWPAQEIPVK